MKFLWINVIAIVIALSSLVVERPYVNLNDLQESLHSMPHFDSETLRNELLRHSEKTIHIAQDFIAIVIIATFAHLLKNFLYYISIFSLLRQKDYFLLI